MVSVSGDKNRIEEVPLIKMNRVYPLREHDIVESIRESYPLHAASTVVIRDEAISRKKIRKVTDAKWGHAYHKSAV